MKNKEEKGCFFQHIPTDPCSIKLSLISSKLKMYCTLLGYDLWRLGFYRLNHKQMNGISHNQFWTGATATESVNDLTGIMIGDEFTFEELLLYFISQWDAIDDGVMGGR